MSAPVGLASVSAVVMRLLGGGVGLDPYISPRYDVTAVTPELVGKTATLNLFLYRVSRNAGYPDVPDRPPLQAPHPPGESSSRFGRLVVDLHYLVSAHSPKPLEAELMLGEAMLTLHEHQHIGRKRIAEILSDQPTVSPPYDAAAVQALPETGALASQVESVTITQEPTGLEQFSQLWSALQTPARPSVCYLVTAVVLERLEPRPIPRIVLSRGPIDPATGKEAGPKLRLIPDADTPRLVAAEMDAGDPSAQLGETIVLRGSGLAAASSVELRRATDAPITLPLGAADGDSAEFVVEELGGPWHPGVYSARVHGAEAFSNALPFQLAPKVEWSTATVGAATGAPATRPLVVTFAPQVADDQEVVVFIGGTGVRAEPGIVAVPATATKPARSRATFRIPDLAVGTYPSRLSVDGVDSHQFDRSTRPPSVRGDQQLAVPV